MAMPNTAHLSLSSIQIGALEERANEYLDKIAQDVIERPHDTRKRSLTIKVEISPEWDAESRVNIPNIDWKIDWSVPGAKGMTTRAFVEDDEIRINQTDPIGRRPDQPSLLQTVREVNG